MAFVDPLSSFRSGQGLVNDFAQQQAQRTAGAALARGSYADAAGALLGAGDLAGGVRVQEYGQQQQLRSREEDTRRRAEQLQFTLQASNALKAVRQQGGDVVAAYDQYLPVFEQMGVPPEQVSEFRQALSTNPDQFLEGVSNFVGQRARELQIVNLGDATAVAVDKATGEEVNRFEGRRKPIELDGVLIDPETLEPILDVRAPKYQTIQNSDGTSSLVAIDQPAPVSSRPQSDVDVLGVIQSVIPGVSFNSGLRTPEQNRTAGGATRSYHLRGQAVDIPPQQGTTPAQLKAQLQAQGVDVRELINEGDHWHIAWGNDQRAPNFGRGERAPNNGGVRTVAQGANNGPTPAQTRADERMRRSEENASRRDEVNLRREFNNRQEVKDFRTIQTAYNSVRSAASNPSAAGDLSLIFAYMKILDPGSVVREQEFANAQNAAGVPDRIRNAYNNALRGERLNPRQRQDFVNQATGLFNSRRQTYDQIAGEYRSYAQDYGVSPDRVAPVDRPSGPQQPRTNAPGLRFNISQPQIETRRRLQGQGARPSEPLGSRLNPRYMNPANPSASFGNVRSGEYFVHPDGSIRRKP